ncbi:DUF4349 domain-containing protein [Senegalia massiliensis]|uniref:DUF4349 domain-containing protein n=1 Tax=Senegalia massiliensis TaxID=1720316 RepID=UPI0013EEEE04|nr:DUF4349 domain-containing protein [Senegalia massiliensis]
MKKITKYFLIVFSLIMAISLFSACSGQDDLSDESSMNTLEKEVSDEEADFNTPEVEGFEIADGEKIISNYFMSLETLDFEKTRSELENLIEKYKSFIENSNVNFRGSSYSKNYRYGDYSIRIPKESLEKFKIDLNQIGNIIEESKNNQDVTKFYRDTESRLKLATAKEKRLLELLEKAEKIEDIIAIESELTNTIYEKERLEKSLKSIDEKIEYTTLNLQLIEVRNFSNTDNIDNSLITRLKNAFTDSIFAFKIALENFIIWLVYALPYILILGVLVLLGVIVIKKRKKK